MGKSAKRAASAHAGECVGAQPVRSWSEAIPIINSVGNSKQVQKP